MTARIPQLLDLFSTERTIDGERESQVEFQGKYAAAAITEPTAQAVLDAFNRFSERDSVSVLIVVGDGEGTAITGKTPGEIAEQLEELHQRKVIANDGEQFSITLTISKVVKNGAASLYSPSHFLSHLKSLSLAERLDVFNDFLSETGSVKLFCDSSVDRFGTRTIFFDVEHAPQPGRKEIDRSEILAKRDEVAYFAEGARYRLVPDDFKLTEKGTDAEWQQFFERMTNLLAVAFTADYSRLTASKEFTFKVNGYKTVLCAVSDEQLIGPTWQAAYEIYDWTYQGGSISDKAGLVRNVLSLQLDAQGCPSYSKDAYLSVRSGFEIYLKRNVAQYIEIKNKLAEFLQGISKDALEDVGDYIGAVKQALGALMTFFISTMILRAVAGKGLTGIFTTEITILTWVFLLVSAIYLFLSLFMLNREMRMIKNSYGRIKTEYSDVLNVDDLARIFRDDQALKEITEEVKRRAVVITVAWLAVVISLAGVAYALQRDDEPPIPQQTINSPGTR